MNKKSILTFLVILYFSDSFFHLTALRKPDSMERESVYCANNFQKLQSSTTSHLSSSNSDHQAQLLQRQCNASLDCLTLMIENPKRIFQISNETYAKCQFTKNDYSVPVTLNEVLGSYSSSILKMHLSDRIEEMIKVSLDQRNTMIFTLKNFLKI